MLKCKKPISEKQMTVIRNLVNDIGVTGIYNQVLSGELARFPRGFWMLGEESKHYAELCVKHLIETVLVLTEQQVKDNISLEFFKQYYLGGMITSLYDNSPHKCLDQVYPGKYKEWELVKIRRDYWNTDTIKEALV